jgi:hypothetical protein
MAALVVPQHHCLRAKTEGFIREIYDREHGARLGAFPPRLLTILDYQGNILCAAGLRSCADGFFSECYLDSPVETVLTRMCGEAVPREQVFEISTFASRSPLSVPHFVGQIIEYGDANGFEWGFFTLTQRLWLLLNRIGLELSPLASADAARVKDSSSWGSYYEKSPKVYAGNRDSLTAQFALRFEHAANA